LWARPSKLLPAISSLFLPYFLPLFVVAQSRDEMTAIRDPVHGYIELDGLALALIDTPQMQRLRWIKQLGLANLVYPGANHTRFEHSLGAYHLARALADHLNLGDEEKLKLGAAALLHDLGHGPLSHATETVLASFLKGEHERIVDILRRGELRGALDSYGLHPAEIQDLISGRGLGRMVSGEIDVDRMDYLSRDSHYTGVAYGVVDRLRLMDKIVLCRGQLAVEAGGVQAATSLLISRLLMQPSVYFHHVCRIAESMISGGIRSMIEGGARPQEIKAMDDGRLFMAMAEAGGNAQEMVSRIWSRRLFKRAVYVGRESLDPMLLRERRAAQEARIAQEVAEEAGLGAEDVLVDLPDLPEAPEGSSLVLVEGDLLPLREVSPLVATLERAQRATWRLGIYCRKEEQERVARAAGRALGLRRSAVQHTFEDLE
jgi:HD superfamily phosphohydrolase